MQVVTNTARILIPMGDLIDRDKELARLNKEKENCEKEIQRFKSKLANEKFVSKAPDQVVTAEREKLAKAEEKLVKVLESIQTL